MPTPYTRIIFNSFFCCANHSVKSKLKFITMFYFTCVVNAVVRIAAFRVAAKKRNMVSFAMEHGNNVKCIRHKGT